MKKFQKEIRNQVNFISLKPKQEEKYVSYLKRRYGAKRAKSFTKTSSS